MAAYTTRYGAEFSKLARFISYNATIDDNATAVIRARTEVEHKSKQDDRGTYKTARRKTTQLILAVIEDTCVQKLRDSETFYTNVAPKPLLAHLQMGCTVCHTLNLLALHNEMQLYHLEVEGIPKYINMLKDA